MKKCDYCYKTATRFHCNHETKELEHLCEAHYAKWHPDLSNPERRKNMKIKEMYEEICYRIPPEGVDILTLKTIIISVTGYHRDETLVHHIKTMESLGYLVKKDLMWFSKWQFPRKGEIKPVKETETDTYEAEREIDEFLEKFR